MTDHPTVLIADDDPEVRHVLRMLFEWEAFEVTAEASDGAEAAKLAAIAQPDFALLDMVMPTMSGADAATLIRALSPRTCIVAFSSILHDRPAWADAYLNKDRIAEVVPALAALMEGAAHA